MKSRGHDRNDPQPKLHHIGFVTGGCIAMHVRNGFARLIGFVVVAAISCGAFAESFDGYIVTDAVPAQQSVLLSAPPSMVVHDNVAMGMQPASDAGSHCHECSTGVCRGQCRQQFDSTEGWINRFLDRCGGGCHWWTAQVDALMLWQGNIPSRPLLKNTTLGGTALDMNQSRTQMGAGPRFGLFFNLDSCHAIEGNYFWVDGFNGQVTVPTGDYQAVTLPGITSVTSGTLLTAGQLKSAELNWRWRNNELLTWLIGFRWVEWNQAMLFDGTNGQGLDAGVAALSGNDLYGSQIGADLLFWNAGGRFRLNGIGKAGIYGNRAFYQAEGTGGGPVAVSGKHASFFGEVGMYGDVAINSWLSWRTGYVLFWLTGAALPGENLSLANFGPPPSGQINLTQSVLVHGVTTGLEARW